MTLAWIITMRNAKYWFFYNILIFYIMMNAKCSSLLILLLVVDILLSLLIHLYQKWSMDSYFIHWVISIILIIYCGAQIGPSSSLKMALMSFWHVPNIFGIALLSDTRRYSRLSLYFPCAAWKQPFFKKLWSCLLENDIRNKDLGTRYVQCYWIIIASRPFKWTELGNMSVHTHTPTRTSVSISLDILKTMSSYWYNSYLTQ